MSDEEMQREIERLKAENAALKKNKAPQALSLKVGDKGGVSLYGINVKFPVTLYKEQWLRLLDFADEIRAFIKTNEQKLKSKGD